MPQHVCLYQDNPEHFVSVQLAILSILEHEPSWHIHLFIPNCPRWLEIWLRPFQAVTLYPETFTLNGWSAKPEAIAYVVDKLQEDVVWLDTDIILTAPISPCLQSFSSSCLVVAEEPVSLLPKGSCVRTRGWGFPIGRKINLSINSGFLKVSLAHRALVSAWALALSDDRYQKAQRMDWWNRAPAFFGDQDVLSALLGSKDFSDVPIAFLRNGIEIAQCHGPDGYPWRFRLRNMFRRLPPLVHAQGKKPWMNDEKALPYIDVSPYKLAAMKYRSEIAETDWLRAHTTSGRLMLWLSFGEPNLAGLLPALYSALRRYLGAVVHFRHERQRRFV